MFGRGEHGAYFHSFPGGNITLKYPLTNIISQSHMLKTLSAEVGGEHRFGNIWYQDLLHYDLQHQFYPTAKQLRRDGAESSGYHRVTLRITQSLNQKRDRDH